MKHYNENIVINFCPTGMIPTKKVTPYVPISVNEIIDDVLKVSEIGITMVHLHARDEISGEPTWKADIYAAIIEGIRRFVPDLIICVSLSGRTFQEFEKRTEPLELTGIHKPDMGSLTLSSLNFNKIASVNEPETIKKIAAKMKEKKIKPELEAFDVGMINYAKYLIKKELLTPPYYLNFILGNIACAQADILHSGIMINDLPENSYWSLGGIGQSQIIMNSLAISVGGGVRVGLEDNIWFDNKRTTLATNTDLLRRIHILAEANEKKIFQPADFRKYLKLNNGNGTYGLQ